VLQTYVGEESKYAYYMLRQSILQQNICQNILPFFVHSWLDRLLIPELVEAGEEEEEEEGRAESEVKAE
jgi:hypothetical protein